MVLLNERTGRFWQLNVTGALILKALLEGDTPEQIAERLARDNRVTRDRTLNDVNRLVNELNQAGLAAS